MGVQLYSRRKNRQWPNLDKLAKHASEAYQNLLSNVTFDLFYAYDHSVLNTNFLSESFSRISFSNKELRKKITKIKMTKMKKVIEEEEMKMTKSGFAVEKLELPKAKFM